MHRCLVETKYSALFIFFKVRFQTPKTCRWMLPKYSLRLFFSIFQADLEKIVILKTTKSSCLYHPWFIKWKQILLCSPRLFYRLTPLQSGQSKMIQLIFCRFQKLNNRCSTALFLLFIGYHTQKSVDEPYCYISEIYQNTTISPYVT